MLIGLLSFLLSGLCGHYQVCCLLVTRYAWTLTYKTLGGGVPVGERR